MTVRDVMTSPVIAVEPTERLLDAFNIMRRKQIKHLPVVEDGQIIGILSDRDLLAHATRENGSYLFPRQTVETVMTKLVISCDAKDSIEKSVNLMLDHDISCLPVLDHGELVGIVTSRSFLKQMKCTESSNQGA